MPICVRSVACGRLREGLWSAILWPSCYTWGSPDGPYEIDQFGACRAVSVIRNVVLAEEISSRTGRPELRDTPRGTARRFGGRWVWVAGRRPGGRANASA